MSVTPFHPLLPVFTGARCMLSFVRGCRIMMMGNHPMTDVGFLTMSPLPPLPCPTNALSTEHVPSDYNMFGRNQLDTRFRAAYRAPCARWAILWKVPLAVDNCGGMPSLTRYECRCQDMGQSVGHNAPKNVAIITEALDFLKSPRREVVRLSVLADTIRPPLFGGRLCSIPQA